MEAEARLVELGRMLSALPQPGGNYLPVRRVGNLLHLAGVISAVAGGVIQDSQVRKVRSVHSTGFEMTR